MKNKPEKTKGYAAGKARFKTLFEFNNKLKESEVHHYKYTYDEYLLANKGYGRNFRLGYNDALKEYRMLKLLERNTDKEN